MSDRATGINSGTPDLLEQNYYFKRLGRGGIQMSDSLDLTSLASNGNSHDVPLLIGIPSVNLSPSSSPPTRIASMLTVLETTSSSWSCSVTAWTALEERINQGGRC
jgi:hypothetical protein